ncbi:MAG: hypothetical protein II882_06310 [Lachnospiraceae bacterium]|nr:hypothetical protein [Lachnospiraceae bacterium]
MFEQYGQYIILACALYCVIMGVRTLLTGKTTAREEARLKDFSERSAKRYRLISAILNILGGIFLAVISVIKMLNPNMDKQVYKIICLVVLLVLVAVYFINWAICKKDN